MREQLAIKPEFDVLLNFDNLILIVSSDWCIINLENSILKAISVKFYKEIFMKQRKYIAIAMVGIPVILSVIGFFCLLESVVVQWDSAGVVQSAVSKYIALVIGLCCGTFGGLYWYSKDRSSLVGVAKRLFRIFDYMVGCIGIIVLSVFLIMNL